MEIVSSKWDFYYNYYYSLATGLINNIGHEFRVSLLKPSYVPDNNSHKYWNDVSGHELTAYSYPVGGITLANKKFTLNEIEGGYYWSANDVVFYLGDVVDVKYAVIYNNSPVVKPLVCWAYIDASTATVNGANFKISIGDIYKIISGNE